MPRQMGAVAVPLLPMAVGPFLPLKPAKGILITTAGYLSGIDLEIYTSSIDDNLYS